MNRLIYRKYTQFTAVVLTMLFLINLLSCAPGLFTKEEGYVELSSSEELRLVNNLDLSSQDIDSWQELEKPLKKNLEYVLAQGQGEVALEKYGLTVTWGDLRRTINKLLNILPRLDDRPELLAQRFDWYELRPLPLFTGYYEPQIEASLLPRKGYNCPIYGQPENLKTVDLGRFHPRWEGETLVYRIKNGTVKPYYSRRTIMERGVLKGEAPIIAWAKSPLDVFYLQIQGSGRLILPDGSKQYIGYDGKNGRQYVSIGRELVDQGYLSWEELSMQSIRSLLNEKPDLKTDILNKNPSFVFFELREDGPYGSMGGILTPMASVAVDPQFLPLGSVLAMNLNLPDEKSEKNELKGLGLAQDVGGVIKGHHLDLFCGTGERARYLAGHLKNKGKVYLMLDARD